jgi:hypothetical protein
VSGKGPYKDCKTSLKYGSSAGPSDRTVCGVRLDRLDAEIMGSNPTQGMDEC